jgi:hypothetical protein
VAQATLNTAGQTLAQATDVSASKREAVVHIVGGPVGATTPVLAFEATVDRVNWFTVTADPTVVGAVIGNLAANVPQTFAWRIQTAGFAAVRVRLVSIAAGALVVTLI